MCPHFPNTSLPSRELITPYLRSHLAPGGYLEHSEVLPVTASDDGSISEGDPFNIGGKLAIESGQRTGKAMDIQPLIKNMISQAGFVDVVEKIYKWPIGDWPADPRLKEIGIMNARHWMEGIEAWSMRLLTQYHGVSSSLLRTRLFGRGLRLIPSSGRPTESDNGTRMCARRSRAVNIMPISLCKLSLSLCTRLYQSRITSNPSLTPHTEVSYTPRNQHSAPFLLFSSALACLSYTTQLFTT